jgi:NarL family two-component system response regulator LiaR
MALTASKRIRVLTVDDHEILRSGIRFALIPFDDIELVGEAQNGEEALVRCGELQPDVALVDMFMPGMDGEATTRAIRSKYPDIQVVILSSFDDADLVHRAMRAGAIGYLVKGVSGSELAGAVRAASEGRPALGSEALASLVAGDDGLPRLGFDLTDREREVLELLAQGLSNLEISRQLSVSISTVKYHIRGIYSKLGAANRAEAAALALQNHLI